MPSVSVIIPNYNREAIIGETIENMLLQSLAPLEIIVVDDGSNDDSVSVIKSFGNKIRLYEQSNKGPGAARNTGLRNASGDFIQFMDSDDLASLNKLEVQVNALLANSADIVYGPWIKVWKENDKIKPQNVVLQQAALPSSRSPLCWFLNNWSMVFQQCLVRRALLQKVGGYREDIYSLEDGDLFVKLLIAGGKLIYEADSLTFYRLDDFGKITASGYQQNRRLMNEALFYETIVASAAKHPELRPCIGHRSFKLKVWRVLDELKKNSVIDNGQLKLLQNLVKGKDWTNFSYNWINIKKSGLQQRLKGHRWPGSYQPGILNDKQINLIGELGWQLV